MQSETKRRIVGALYFGIPFLLFLYLGRFYLLIFFILLSLISLFELLEISGLKDFFYLPAVFIPFFLRRDISFILILLYTFLIFLIRGYKRDKFEDKILYPFIFIVISSIPLSFFYLMREEKGATFSIVVILSIWIDDISAYFLGKRFGKTKTVPHISPGKSYEGLLSSFIVLTIFLIIVSFTLKIFSPLKSILLSLLVVSLSFLGDIFESLIKRRFNVKDSGKIILGHGGVMDRIDSLIFTIPVLFYLI